MVHKTVSYEEFINYRKKFNKKHKRLKVKKLILSKLKTFIVFFTFLVLFPCILYFFTEVPTTLSVYLNCSMDTGIIYSSKIIDTHYDKLTCSYTISLKNGLSKTIKVTHRTRNLSYSLKEKIFIFTSENNSHNVYSFKELSKILIIIPFCVLFVLFLPLILIYKNQFKKICF